MGSGNVDIVPGTNSGVSVKSRWRAEAFGLVMLVATSLGLVLHAAAHSGQKQGAASDPLAIRIDAADPYADLSRIEVIRRRGELPLAYLYLDSSTQAPIVVL